MTMQSKATPGYGPVLVVVISGAALLLFGVLSSTNTGTVGGITLGAAIVSLGLMLAVDVWVRNRRARRVGYASRSTVDVIHRSQDRSREEARAARSSEGRQ